MRPDIVVIDEADEVPEHVWEHQQYAMGVTVARRRYGWIQEPVKKRQINDFSEWLLYKHNKKEMRDVQIETPTQQRYIGIDPAVEGRDFHWGPDITTGTAV